MGKEKRTKKTHVVSLDAARNPRSSDVEFVRDKVKDLVYVIVRNDPREFDSNRHELIDLIFQIEDTLSDGHTLRSQFQYWFALLIYIKCGMEVFFIGDWKYETFHKFKREWEEASKAIEEIY